MWILHSNCKKARKVALQKNLHPLAPGLHLANCVKGRVGQLYYPVFICICIFYLHTQWLQSRPELCILLRQRKRWHLTKRLCQRPVWEHHSEASPSSQETNPRNEAHLSCAEAKRSTEICPTLRWLHYFISRVWLMWSKCTWWVHGGAPRQRQCSMPKALWSKAWVGNLLWTSGWCFS